MAAETALRPRTLAPGDCCLRASDASARLRRIRPSPKARQVRAAFTEEAGLAFIARQLARTEQGEDSRWLLPETRRDAGRPGRQPTVDMHVDSEGAEELRPPLLSGASDGAADRGRCGRGVARGWAGAAGRAARMLRRSYVWLHGHAGRRGGQRAAGG